MTEQQEHLTNLLKQRQALKEEYEQLSALLTTKRDLLLRVDGAIEYLSQIGVTVAEPVDGSDEDEKEIAEE